MNVNTYNSVVAQATTAYSKSVTKNDDKAEVKEKSSSSSFSEKAYVYEKSDQASNPKKMSKSERQALVQQLKDDAEQMKQNLFDIVKKSISGQGNAFSIASEDDMWKVLASGKFTASADDIAKAKEDISEDGYWGVKKTSSRIVDFAIALSGGDTSKADTLINAFKKGFSQATAAWGKTLPDISSQTYDAVMDKFDQWKNGTYQSDSQ